MANLKNAELVEKLKGRLHIFHSMQDGVFDDWITASIQAIQDRTGFKTTEDPRFKELVMERCRYIYNDSLEFFDDNFQSSLLSLSVSAYTIEESEDDDEQTNI